MHRAIIAIAKYVKIGRPYYVIPAVASAVAGYCSGNTNGTIFNCVTIGIAFQMLAMACWSANDIADRKTDSRGRMKQKWGLYVSGGTTIISSGKISVKSAVLYTVMLAATGLIVAALMGMASFLVSLLFLAIGMAYSLKPIRLKNLGFIGLSAVATACGMIAFIAGWVAGGQFPNRECLLFASLLSVTFLGFEGLAQLLDHDQDRQNGEKTISVSLGCKATRNLLAICQLLPALALIILCQFEHSTVPNLNCFLLTLLIAFSTLTAVLTIVSRKEQLISSLRILSVPLMAAFAFLVV